ncbi:hypothetical protein IMAU80009_03441 [Lactiplantibacillus plantarum]|uniref:DUF1642 domain-containing protein n=1 Tax=Lactiplantibacillus plantarum TaxID=1590 RepID=UPI00309F0E45|nr:hypothetical protein [Lactiplantibacillus plantarum]
MSNETKRDVFEKALREWNDLVHSCGLQGEEAHGGCEFDPILIKYKKDYAAALPDDLPVIPKNVAYLIKQDKEWNYNLGMVFDDAFHGWIWENGIGKWIITHSDTFARAWLDGYVVEVEK